MQRVYFNYFKEERTLNCQQVYTYKWTIISSLWIKLGFRSAGKPISSTRNQVCFQTFTETDFGPSHLLTSKMTIAVGFDVIGQQEMALTSWNSENWQLPLQRQCRLCNIPTAITLTGSIVTTLSLSEGKKWGYPIIILSDNSTSLHALCSVNQRWKLLSAGTWCFWRTSTDVRDCLPLSLPTHPP